MGLEPPGCQCRCQYLPVFSNLLETLKMNYKISLFLKSLPSSAAVIVLVCVIFAVYVSDGENDALLFRSSTC